MLTIDINTKRHTDGYFSPFFFYLPGEEDDNWTCAMSVQGSTVHYCSPKRNLENLTDYSLVEVSLIFNPHKPLTIEGVQNFLPEDIVSKLDGSEAPVLNFLQLARVETIAQAVYQACETLAIKQADGIMPEGRRMPAMGM